MLIFGEYSLKIGTQIVNWYLEYSLRSHDPAHTMYLSSANNTTKTVEFQWHKFLSGHSVCIIKKTFKD